MQASFTRAPAATVPASPLAGRRTFATAPRPSLRSNAAKEPHDGQSGPYEKPPPSAAEAEGLQRAKEDKNLRDLPSQAGQAGVQRSAAKEPNMRGAKYPTVEEHLKEGKTMLEAIEGVHQQKREQSGEGVVPKAGKKLN
ncbi:hypothetical protein D9Q98_003956 [Chlorella vulgaris]|uniref:Uncharacterized protein n=1 Tax=Chlorella vulgaris TaxID=3077 RepID=A0A9D4YXY1_CHLVU|nr:hypothetical protein D9Q98_003956 [Chlorella vulgaris]